MKRGMMILLLLGMIILFNIFFVSSDFVDNGNLVQNVTDCGVLNTSNAIYTLNQSINSSFECLNINASNITLDCQGYNITFGNESGGFGIAVTSDGGETGINNVTIRNCYLIQNESALNETAIFFGGGSENGVAYNNTIITYGNGSNGIKLETSSVNANITTNNITTFGADSHGIVLGDNGSNANILSNIVTTNGIESYGIILNEMGTNGSINLNDVTTLETGAHGILLGENGTGTNITSNAVATSGEDASGIKMGDGSSGLVYNNTVTATGNWSETENTAMGGIWLESNTDGINVSTNTIAISGYNTAGIWIWSCYNHSIETNIITSSGQLGDGIYLSDVQGINVTSNIINITGEWGDGIASSNSETALVFYNNIITTSGYLAYGFNLDQDSNSNISSNNITTSGAYSYGIYSIQSHNNTIADNIIETGDSDSYVLYFNISSGDVVYNNIFNTSTTGSGVYINDSDLNYFNMTNTTSTNIIGRVHIGGNFWTNNNGNGYSDRCINLDNDYFCDSAYTVVAGESHTDYLPLADHVSWAPLCATLNIENKSYYLNQSISSNGTCFNVTANGITLDFNGFNITGNTTGYGVNVTGYNDTVILDGFIYNFSIGIYFGGSANNNITNMTSNDNNLHGIAFSTNLNSSLTTITVSDNGGKGIILETSSNNLFVDVTANSNNLSGIYLGNSSNNTFTSFNINYSGIYLGNSSSNLFTDFNISNSTTDAILLQYASSDDNNFTNMVVTNTSLSKQDINFSTAGIDGTWIIGISHFADYSFAGVGGKVNFKEPSFGEIVFLEAINGSGTNLGSDVDIDDNWVFVNSSNNIGLNRSANITLYSITYTDPKPQYSSDGSTYTECTSTTNPSCTEISYNATTDIYVFNASHFTYFNTAEGYVAPVTLSEGGGGGGGGATSFWTKIYVITGEQFKQNYTEELSVKHRMRVIISNEYHYVGIVELTSTAATINVSSISQQAVFNVGDEKKFDVTDDEYYDIYVRLDSIADDKANVTIKSIHEQILEQQPEETEDSSNAEDVVAGSGGEKLEEGKNSLIWLWAMFVIIVIAGIVFYFWRKN